MRHYKITLAALVCTLCVCANTADFYISPNGSGDGSFANPWSLSQAVSNPVIVQGSIAVGPVTLWLRGGVYAGSWVSQLGSVAAYPITVRSYIGEHAILDGAPSVATTLYIQGANTTWTDFEVTNSSPMRAVPAGGSGRPAGIEITGPSTRCINLVVHDTGQGVGFWATATDSELYGNIIYYNGWEDSSGSGHGHGIYAQNQFGTKRITNNTIWDQFGYGIQVYGSSAAFLDNFIVEGNSTFRNGAIATNQVGQNLLLGGGRIASNSVVVSNRLYNPYWYSRAGNLETCYQKGCSGQVLANNYSAGKQSISLQLQPTGLVAMGNTFIGSLGDNANAYLTGTLNTYFSDPVPQSIPSPAIFLQPNKYDPLRATLTVYNWTLATAVSVDLASFLVVGEPFKVMDIQNYFGPPVLSGVYAGGILQVPMTPGPIVAPVGTVSHPPTSTRPEFAVFQVIRGVQ